MGAEIRTFLLERSRVTSTSKPHERAYHIMYQVAVGTSLMGRPLEAVRYLSMSGCSSIEGVDDRREFDEVRQALPTAVHR